MEQNCRVFCVSDVHTDHHENWNLLESWSKNSDLLNVNKETDVLIVAGDISTDLELLKETLLLIKTIFNYVFFCPGNNELRLRKKEVAKFAKSFKIQTFKHSVEKFHYVLSLCKEIGVYVEPTKINGVWIVPLFAWYTPYFDKYYDGNTKYKKQWLDFYKITWPEEIGSSIEAPSSYFAKLNEKSLKSNYDGPVITYSHFLPRFELLPHRRFIKKSLPLVVGSPLLEEQLRSIGSVVHICGHTHINVDKTLNGVRYIQNALGHPVEQKSIWRMSFSAYAPKLVFNSKDSQGQSCSIM